MPQGSFLGPIFYLLFTNDLPEKVIHNEYLFGKYCQKCGITVTYADDSSYTIAAENSNILIEMVNSVLENWVSYCNRNFLKKMQIRHL